MQCALRDHHQRLSQFDP
ncbi:hypothetical protein Pmani_040151, partial [Petrolisthes manimaculis]